MKLLHLLPQLLQLLLDLPDLGLVVLRHGRLLLDYVLRLLDLGHHPGVLLRLGLEVLPLLSKEQLLPPRALAQFMLQGVLLLLALRQRLLHLRELPLLGVNLVLQLLQLLLRGAGHGALRLHLLLQILHVHLQLRLLLQQLLLALLVRLEPCAALLQRRLQRLQLLLRLLDALRRRLHLILPLPRRLAHLCPLLLDLVQLLPRVAQLLVIDGVLQPALLLVQLLVLVQLLPLRVQLAQLLIQLLDHFLDLVLPDLVLLHDLQALAPALLIHLGPADLLQQVEPLAVLHGRHFHDLSLLDHVVRIRPGEARALKKVHHLRLRDVLLVQKVLVLLHANGAAQADLVPVHREAIVSVVEHHLDVRGQDVVARTLMEQLYPVLLLQVCEYVAQHKADSMKEV
mmetsp:Transcript_35617/g.90934  ORF Transcript_35617/g.90934 Transcript_35617/m.90934 type:complete len:398 (+) Transcript_35617:2591-3784(+)